MPHLLNEGWYRVSALSIRLLTEPDYGATLDDQAILGEEVQVIGSCREFTRVRVLASGKEGWVADAFQKISLPLAGSPVATHRVSTPWAITFHGPDPESETMFRLPMNALVAIGDMRVHNGDTFGRVLGLSGNADAWARLSSLMAADRHEADFVAVQERMVNLPYVWGARDSTLGFDCSGLLFTSLRASGQAFCPRDTVDQVASAWLGSEIDIPPRGLTYERGDVVFWKGHVATMVSRTHCVHATDMRPYHRVLIQELSRAMNERLVAGKGSLVKVRRFSQYHSGRIKGLVAS